MSAQMLADKAVRACDEDAIANHSGELPASLSPKRGLL